MSALALALAGVLGDGSNIVLELGRNLLANLPYLGHNRIVPHGYSPIGLPEDDGHRLMLPT